MTISVLSENVCKSFGRTSVLHDVSLSIGPAERLVIVGPSGAGKSTLLRLIAGLDTPDSGRLIVRESRGQVEVSTEGKSNVARPAARSGAGWFAARRRDAKKNIADISFVGQDYPLYPRLSVEKNLYTALASLAIPHEQQKQRIEEAIDWFQLQTLIDRTSDQLSGGQAQRVALAKAVVRRSALLLLDEPLSQLDSMLREEVRELILSTVERYHMTLILVTHDPMDALRIGDRVAVMDQGKVIQSGCPTHVYRNPASRLVGNLLSPYGMNWISIEQIQWQRELKLDWLSQPAADACWISEINPRTSAVQGTPGCTESQLQARQEPNRVEPKRVAAQFAALQQSGSQGWLGFRPEDAHIVTPESIPNCTSSSPGLWLRCSHWRSQELGAFLLSLGQSTGETVRVLTPIQAAAIADATTGNLLTTANHHAIFVPAERLTIVEK